ncbi:BQ5605_C027g10328 [Microbotryum silenes-dioicae]|uniref:BQ5605_C027g10328 protein n=1 Tax=Microbotryum silenes-dioicae TaxID=796604 RepID=A0A2X0MN91_9BASI|nr:BQ5605_C027g10328 [Microbotryum silenes-dioicae]
MASDRGPTRLNMPELKAPFTEEDVILRLGHCDDAIEAFEDLKRREATLSVVRQIREAGMKMQGEGKIWWNQNKDELKGLATWSLFAAQVKARFLDSGFTLSVEHAFYQLVLCRSSRHPCQCPTSPADSPKIINDDRFKRHHLHHANDLLYARITSTAGFSLSTFSVNDPIGHMTAVASSLGHEWMSQASVANSRNIGDSFMADPKLKMARRTPLTADTRQECINEGRCFSCREMGPQYPGMPDEETKHDRGGPPQGATKLPWAWVSLIVGLGISWTLLLRQNGMGKKRTAKKKRRSRGG